ncbi:MAG TPA: thioesterase family protein [Burkholderiales bacterium]|nr:thioesterase family protein [Burkholderiales bacterium]
MFRFAQPIRFSHCDPAGVLYFPHVFDFVSAALEDWFAQRLGLPFHAMHLELRRGNPVVRTHCEFLTPCRFGEALVLDLEPISVGRSSIETRMAGTVEGAARFNVRHKTAMMSMETMRAIPLPDELRARAIAEMENEESTALSAISGEEVPPNAWHSRQLVRYAHCDPGERVYFARFFDMFNAVLEDWFAEGLGCPWGTEFMVPPRDLRAPSLVIGAEFLRACVLGEMLEFDLWVKRLGRSFFDLALIGAVKGELRLRAAWTLCTISFATMKSAPLPDDLRAGMERFLAV